MTSRPFAFALALCASGLAAAACGGRSSELSRIVEDGGGSSGGGSGSGSGGSSGGGSGSGSGGSSGGGSGSGGNSGGGSGSSSGGAPTCPASVPTGACTEDGQSCSYSDTTDCGPTCQCESGQWQCVSPPCVAPPPTCPAVSPGNGASCIGSNPETCTYSNGPECGDSVCTCDGYSWNCAAFTCTTPPVTCPMFPPGNGDSCSGGTGSCVYDVNGDCLEESCSCSESNTWTCGYSDQCLDAGP